MVLQQRLFFVFFIQNGLGQIQLKRTVSGLKMKSMTLQKLIKIVSSRKFSSSDMSKFTKRKSYFTAKHKIICADKNKCFFSTSPFSTRFPLSDLSCLHFCTDWLSRLGPSNQVGSTTDHLANCYLPSTPKDRSTMKEELTE